VSSLLSELGPSLHLLACSAFRLRLFLNGIQILVLLDRLVKALTFESAHSDASAPEKEPLKVSKAFRKSCAQKGLRLWGRLQVVLRIRPLDSARKVSVINELEDGKSVRLVAPKSSAAFKSGGDTEETFHFTGVFGADTSQETVYAQIAHPILRSVLGFECDGLIFSFGVTNSGKSYTIHGTPDQPGITPRVLKAVFSSLKPSATEAGVDEQRIAVDLDNYR
jgi:hypothetical protein